MVEATLNWRGPDLSNKIRCECLREILVLNFGSKVNKIRFDNSDFMNQIKHIHKQNFTHRLPSAEKKNCY